MTCIIAAVENGKVYMGGDSAVLGDTWDRSTIACSKIVYKGPVLIGCAGSSLLLQSLRWHLYANQLPYREPRVGPLEYWLIDGVFPAMQEAFDKAKFDWPEDETKSAFILGTEGRLFLVCQGWQLLEYTSPVIGLGSASDYAIGAWAAMEHETDPSERMLKALAVASRFSNAAAPPFYVEHV